MDTVDIEWMQRALALARIGLGQAWPNPSVGCALVRDGRLVGEGTTAPGGRPHAEAMALRIAGADARGATAYVSLEPCNHFGKTPPCSIALIEAGVRRVVVAALDPDPRVNGSGLARLRAEGLRVDTGVCQAEALELNAGFFLRVRRGWPRVTVAVLPAGAARAEWLAACRHDAIMGSLAAPPAPPAPQQATATRGAGALQVLCDLDGSLGLVAGPSHGLLPELRTGPWLVRPQASSQAGAAASQRGPVVTVACTAAGAFDPATALLALGGRGLTSIVVDAADPLAQLLRAAHLVDEEVPCKPPPP